MPLTVALGGVESKGSRVQGQSGLGAILSQKTRAEWKFEKSIYTRLCSVLSQGPEATSEWLTTDRNIKYGVRGFQYDIPKSVCIYRDEVSPRSTETSNILKWAFLYQTHSTTNYV